MSLNKRSKFFKNWIQDMKRGGYLETSLYPISYITKKNEFAYSPLGVLYRGFMVQHPERYGLFYKEEGRSRNGGYKICTLKEHRGQRTYLTSLPRELYHRLGMDSEGFAIYVDRLREENKRILDKKIARISEDMAMSMDAGAGEFVALKNIRAALSYQKRGFTLNDATTVGLPHKVIATLMNEAGDSDLDHGVVYDLRRNELELPTAAD
jgi:hypothetical protein